MAVFRVQRRKIIPLCPTIICNKALSLKAKGFIFDTVSARRWDYTTRGLASICKVWTAYVPPCAS